MKAMASHFGGHQWTELKSSMCELLKLLIMFSPVCRNLGITVLETCQNSSLVDPASLGLLHFNRSESIEKYYAVLL